MKQRDFHIRPLSEGLGLGSLKTVTQKSKLADIDTSVMRQAHAAYAPNSVASEIRRRPASIARNSIVRFVAGAGTDLFVGTFTFSLLILIGVIAWQTGETSKIDILSAFRAVSDFVARLSVAQIVAALICIGIMWRLMRNVFSKFLMS